MLLLRFFFVWQLHFLLLAFVPLLFTTIVRMGEVEEETETIGGKKYVRDATTQKFEVIKTLKDKETGNVGQEKVDSIHEEENVASARLRYLQKKNNLL